MIALHKAEVSGQGQGIGRSTQSSRERGPNSSLKARGRISLAILESYGPQDP
jgi:hypothetical protein